MYKETWLYKTQILFNAANFGSEGNILYKNVLHSFILEAILIQTWCKILWIIYQSLFTTFWNSMWKQRFATRFWISYIYYMVHVAYLYFSWRIYDLVLSHSCNKLDHKLNPMLRNNLYYLRKFLRYYTEINTVHDESG